MHSLNSKQRAFLRSMAHHLKPVVHVGNEGVSEALLASVGDAFNTRELIKVKVLENAPEDPRTTGDRIVEGIPDTHVAQTIGRTIVLYRPFPEGPEIRLP